MDADQLEFLLTEAHYPRKKHDFVIYGFRNEFSLGYENDQKVQLRSENLKFTEGVGDEVEFWNKVMKEVQLKRYAGLYTDIPE